MNYSTPQDRIAFVSSLPGAIGDLMHLIEQNADDEQAGQLVQFAASFVHPDMVCSMSLLHSLPESAKTAVSRFFLYAIDDGLSQQLSAQLYDFLTPHLLGQFRHRA